MYTKKCPHCGVKMDIEAEDNCWSCNKDLNKKPKKKRKTVYIVMQELGIGDTIIKVFKKKKKAMKYLGKQPSDHYYVTHKIY